MRLYISGPMTGYPEFNYPAFEKAAAALREAGHEVVSPHEVNPPSEDGHEWEWYMRRDIAALVTCDAVACLSGWRTSRGASLECHIAEALGMPIEPWLDFLPTAVGVPA